MVRDQMSRVNAPRDLRISPQKQTGTRGSPPFDQV